MTVDRLLVRRKETGRVRNEVVTSVGLCLGVLLFGFFVFDATIFFSQR